MVENLSRHIALWLIKSGILKDDDSELYIYAIQYLLLIINPTVIFTVYCIATHNTWIGLIEVFSFLLIRKYSGGYHCQSSTACLIFSVIVLIIMAWLSSVLKPSLFLISALIISDVELIIKGPIISINHTVSDLEKKYYHKCLGVILLFLNIIIVITDLWHLYSISSCISIVIIFCSLLHILCMTKKNRELYY
mgnify:FL=1